MADKKPPEDEFIDENFADEFEFEEGSAGEANSSSSSVSFSDKRGGSQKYLLVGIFIGFLGILGYLGYRFFHKTDAKSTASASAASPGTTTPGSTTLVARPQPTAITEQDVAGLLKSKTASTAQPEKQKEPIPSTPAAVAETPREKPNATVSAGAANATEGSTKPSESSKIIEPPATTAELSKTSDNKIAETTGTKATTEVTEAGSATEKTQVKTTNEATEPKTAIETKAAEGMATEAISQTTTTAIAVPPSEAGPSGEKSELPATAATPTAKATHPSTATEMQEFHQQIQKTLEAFTKLNQQMENNLNQVKYLDSYTREVSLTVEKLSAQVTAMDNRIQALTHLANSLSKDLGKVRNEVGYVKRVIGDDGLDVPPAPTASRQRSVEYPYPNAIEDGIDCNPALTATRKRGGQGARSEDLEYVVHAVIPGRAWLKSAKGQIITVTEGENLGNYGKILVIDAANGVVLTSSGITFR